MSKEIEEYAARLIQDLNPAKLDRHRRKTQTIKKYYEPRAIFNRWRDSDLGQLWKQQQFQQLTDNQCPACKAQLPSIDYFQIDHIQPISKYPHLATETTNLRLLCAPCNSKKSQN